LSLFLLLLFKLLFDAFSDESANAISMTGAAAAAGADDDGYR